MCERASVDAQQVNSFIAEAEKLVGARNVIPLEAFRASGFEMLRSEVASALLAGMTPAQWVEAKIALHAARGGDDAVVPEEVAAE